MACYVGRLVAFAADRALARRFIEKWTELPVVHVTGTKGKGSTCAFVEAILGKDGGRGLRTGTFTSPHLVFTDPTLLPGIYCHPTAPSHPPGACHTLGLTALLHGGGASGMGRFASRSGFA